jgi:hypothetical protein
MIYRYLKYAGTMYTPREAVPVGRRSPPQPRQEPLARLRRGRDQVTRHSPHVGYEEDGPSSSVSGVQIRIRDFCTVPYGCPTVMLVPRGNKPQAKKSLLPRQAHTERHYATFSL